MNGRQPVLAALVVGIAAGVALTLLVQGWRGAVREEAPSPPPASAPEQPPSPHGGTMPADDVHGGGGGGHEATFAKIHFMRKFVAALTEPPRNLMPNPDYAPLLREGAAPIRCADCHTDPSLNMEAMIANDPGDEAVQPVRMQRRRIMIPLMEKWVGRLNTRHRDRLRKEVTCTDCHDLDPRDEEARNAMLPPLMIRFVRALKEPPVNENPAAGWRPLLKDPATPSMLCATCHGQVGASMERNLDALAGPTPPEAKENRQFMINLMERWVRELNKRMKDQLVKAVACTDCHEIDPRK